MSNYLKSATLRNFGPFQDEAKLSSSTIYLAPYKKLKKSRETLIYSEYLPLALLYGPNSVGKTCFFNTLRQVKNTKEYGFFDVFHTYLNEEQKNKLASGENLDIEISLEFGKYTFNVSPIDTFHTKLELLKGDKVILSSHGKDFFDDEKSKVVTDFLKRIYFVSQYDIIMHDLVKFIKDNIVTASAILADADLGCERFELDPFDEYGGLQIVYSNGRKEKLSYCSDTIRYFVLLMPLFIDDSPYDVFFVDGILENFHPKLQEIIIRSHVYRRKGKQLIATTNNPGLLKLVDEGEGVRKDEVYFIEQNRNTGISKICSLIDFIPPDKKKLDTEKDYLDGRFGATPLPLCLTR